MSSLVTLETGVLRQLNEIRSANGLLPLVVNRGLVAAATQHTAEMLADGYFAHASANGTPFWKRIAHYYSLRPASSWSVGENLLSAAPGLTAQDALALWMASAPHRQNILSPAWTDVGIAAFSAAAAGGAYDGQPVTLLTVDFGGRGSPSEST